MVKVYVTVKALRKQALTLKPNQVNSALMGKQIRCPVGSRAEKRKLCKVPPYAAQGVRLIAGAFLRALVN